MNKQIKDLIVPVLIVTALFILCLSVIYSTDNTSPQEYCIANFYPADPYFISSSFNKDTGELICTIDKEVKESRIFSAEYAFWTGIHVRLR